MVILASGSPVRATLLLGLLLLSPWLRADLAAHVDRQVIDENDVIVLEIRYGGQARDDFGSSDLRFDRLEEDFVILNQQRAHQLTLIQGRPHAVTSWSLTLQPTRRGALTIPSFSVDGQQTEPITITVTEPTAQARQEMAQMVFMETFVSSNEVWVQEQITYRVRLYYSENAVLFGELPPMPRFEEAVVEPMGGASNHVEVRDGQNYLVIERRYALVPQRSGTLELPPESFVGAVRLSTPDGAIRRRNLRLSSEGHSIKVKPQPDAWPADAPWLPARDLTLDDAFDPTPPRFRQGEPVHRVLTLQAQGLAASSLPELDFGTVAGVRKYPESPALDEDRRGDRFIATRIQAVTLIAQVVDFIDLPEISVLWWDLDTDTIRRAVIPSRRFPVAPSNLPRALPDPEAGPDAANGRVRIEATDTQPETPVGEIRTWPALTLIAILLWVGAALYGLWHLRQRRRQPVSTIPPPLHAAAERKALLAACAANDPEKARRALDRWLRACGDHGDTLLQRARLQSRPALRPVLSELDRALYSPTAAAPWNGNALANWVRQYDHSVQPRRPRPAALPKLYAPNR
ncbi:MAG: protein BatD [Gammaproteobacteria bacterium]|nr:protein BatD [Gammaproteobacteria bacterium]